MRVTEEENAVNSPHEPHRVQHLGNKNHKLGGSTGGEKQLTPDSCDYPCLAVRNAVILFSFHSKEFAGQVPEINRIERLGV